MYMYTGTDGEKNKTEIRVTRSTRSTDALQGSPSRG